MSGLPAALLWFGLGLVWFGVSGGSIHYTTYQCAVEGFGSAADLSNIRKEVTDRVTGGDTGREERTICV